MRHDRNKVANTTEAWADGDDDDEKGEPEHEEGEGEEGGGLKRRHTNILYLTTEAV
jgi:hypothetical protein